MEIGSDAHWVLKDRLLLSRAPRSPQELQDLRRAGVTHVLCLLPGGEEGNWAASAGLRFLSWPIEDMGSPSVSALSSAVDRVRSVLAGPGRSLLVHCQAGLGRSGAVAASYLGASAALPATQAIAFVRRQRPNSLWSQDKEVAVEAFLEGYAQGRTPSEGAQPCSKCGARVLRPYRRCFPCSRLSSIEEFFDQDLPG